MIAFKRRYALVIVGALVSLGAESAISRRWRARWRDLLIGACANAGADPRTAEAAEELFRLHPEEKSRDVLIEKLLDKVGLIPWYHRDEAALLHALNQAIRREFAALDEVVLLGRLYTTMTEARWMALASLMGT